MTTRELLHDALALTELSFANENPKYIKKTKEQDTLPHFVEHSVC